MSYNPPIPGTGISAVTRGLSSRRVFYQMPGGIIRQSVRVENIWSHNDTPIYAVPLSPLASVSWDHGKEIRVYYLDRDYIVQEYCYNDVAGWIPGRIGELNARAAPTSRLSAITYDDGSGPQVRVYYQDAESHAISELCNNGSWFTGELRLSGALEGTSIAAVTYAWEGFVQIRLYYQSSFGFDIREHCHNERGWFPGQFNSGKAPLRTPIGAIAFGNVQMQVYWRDLDTNVVFMRHTGYWNPPTIVNNIGPGFQFTTAHLQDGKLIRIYFQDYLCTIYEYCSDDDGSTWFAGHKLTD